MKPKNVISDIAKLFQNGFEDDALTILETYHNEICVKQREICKVGRRKYGYVTPWPILEFEK